MAVILLSLAIMSGCGLQPYVQTDVAGYPYRYADFDYKYAWKSTRTNQGVAIEGVMKNVRYPAISSVQLTVLLLQKDGKIVGRESTFPMPQQSRENDVCHYSLLLKGIKPVVGDLLQFHVHYRGNEGNDEAIDWISSFKVDALTGAIIEPANSRPDKW
jgi:hypothetical protein